MMSIYLIYFITGFINFSIPPMFVHISIISFMGIKMVLSVYGRQGFVPLIWLACCLCCAIIWGLFLYFTGLTDVINRNTENIILFIITLIVFKTSMPKVKSFIKQKPTAVKIAIISFWTLFLINPFTLHPLT
jgi:branched-subunit amino acid ABC-type transport system permease component